jgi:hypothetical protein
MTTSPRVGITCSFCDDQLLHCHGVAIVFDGEATCSDDPDCDLAIEFHHFVAREDEVVAESPLRVAVNG